MELPRLALPIGAAASARGRSPAAWFFIGLIFGIFGLIAVLVMEKQA